MQQIPTQAPDFPPSFSILVVDDSLISRKVIEKKCLEVLEGRGLLYSVQAAENGLQGLALCETNQYDYYIIDKEMPDICGVVVCRTILKEKPTAKVVLFTAAEPDELAKENIPGGVEVIPKDLTMLENSLTERINVVKARTMAGRKNSSGGQID